MVAILNNEGDKDAITDYLIDASGSASGSCCPTSTSPGVDFRIEGTDAIRFGLSNIKFLSGITAAKLLDKAPYKTMLSCTRTSWRRAMAFPHGRCRV
jgi:DNA polymerase III alpha subunit